jgi:hypothetical protein
MIRFEGKNNENALRYMEFYITDSRIRIWRQMFLNQLKLNDLDSAGCVTGAVGRGDHLIKKRRIEGEAEVYMCVYICIYTHVYVCIHIKSN